MEELQIFTREIDTVNNLAKKNKSKIIIKLII